MEVCKQAITFIFLLISNADYILAENVDLQTIPFTF
jgi:hypothetical protein